MLRAKQAFRTHNNSIILIGMTAFNVRAINKIINNPIATSEIGGVL